MRRTRYHSIPRDDIHEFVSFTGCKTLNEMVEKAHEREMELDVRTNWKTEQAQAAGGKDKKPKTSDSSGRSQQGRGRCAKCGRFHNGVYRTAVISGCYSYGQQGHVSKDCPKKGLICFHCNQTGHKRPTVRGSRKGRSSGGVCTCYIEDH